MTGEEVVPNQSSFGGSSAKACVEVHAGVIPGKPMPEYTRTWWWSSEDQESLAMGGEAARQRWTAIMGESREYAATLEDPRRVNWVRRDWLWL